MNQAVARSFARAASADLLENPSVIFALSKVTEEGKQATINFILGDILRGLKHERGPVGFPHLRASFLHAIQDKAEGRKGSGLSAIEQEKGFDWSSLFKTVVGGIAAVGTAYYVGKIGVKGEKEILKQQQAGETALREAEASRMIALSKQTETRVEQQYGSPGLPGWVLPVGIAAGAAGLIFLVVK